MGRSPGSAGARDGMKRAVALVVAAMLVGCAHTGVAINSSGTVAAGTTAVSGSVAASGSGTAALAFFALAAMAIHSTESWNGNTNYNANPFAGISSSQQPPELDGKRRVNEQDCSKPIRDWSANLKCK